MKKSRKIAISTVNDEQIVEAWFDQNSKQSFRQSLLKWFRVHRREMPWRESRDPYRVWVSEIMLQQTQVATVIDYFRRFIRQFPTVEKLATADEQSVLRQWEGLGYYRRARQLHAAAKMIVAEFEGTFPATVDELLRLPGVGRYTAGAIASIAFDESAPILEGNTVRLFARLMGLTEDVRVSKTQKILWRFSERLVPAKGAGEFNQALMELGSLVCRDRDPNCRACPVARSCVAFSLGTQREIPVASPKFEYESIREAAVVLRRGKNVLMRLCQPSERWAGLWDFPRYPFPHGDPVSNLTRLIKKDSGLDLELDEERLSLRHAVTRFRIELKCYGGRVRSGRLKRNSAFQWVSLHDIDELPLSATGRKIARSISAFF